MDTEISMDIFFGVRFKQTPQALSFKSVCVPSIFVQYLFLRRTNIMLIYAESINNSSVFFLSINNVKNPKTNK